MDFIRLMASSQVSVLNEVEFPNFFGFSFNYFRGFTIFGIDIYWYGVIIAIAVMSAFFYGLKRSKFFGLVSDDVFDTVFFALFGAYIGARVYYVIFENLNPDNLNKYTIITTFTRFRDGGLALYGGIIGAFVVGTIVALIKKQKLLPMYDLAGSGILLGQAIGRWANFINQEAYGAATAGDLPWGMTGTIISREVGKEVLVHPCFLYESLWCLIGFLALYFYSKKLRTFNGEMILLYTFWYGAGRGWIEGLRTDSLYWGSFRVSQVLAIGSAVIALGLFIFFKIKFSKTEGYLLYNDTEESKRKIADFEERIRKEKQGEKAPSILAEEFQSEDVDVDVDIDNDNDMDAEDSDIIESDVVLRDNSIDDHTDDKEEIIVDEAQSDEDVDVDENDSQNEEEV